MEYLQEAPCLDGRDPSFIGNQHNFCYFPSFQILSDEKFLFVTASRAWMLSAGGSKNFLI